MPNLQEFWDRRYRTFALEESGWLGAGAQANARLYSCKTQALDKALKRIGMARERSFSVLDVGCGQGFFRTHYASAYPAARYSGLDISGRLIDHLRLAFPENDFSCGDIARWRPQDGERFDIVQAFEVLHLIMEQQGVADALKGMAAALAPEGRVLVTAVMPPARAQPNPYNAHPSADAMLELFAEAGLAVEAVDQIYFWLPDGGPRHRVLNRLLRLGSDDLVYRLDRLALRWRMPEIFGGGLDSRMKLITLRHEKAPG